MRELLSLILVLGGLSVNAATYYLSPTGNDSNNGTSQSTPWRTIDRANQLSSSFQPGDRILFQRGGEYRGKLSILNSGNATAYIEVGAYGTGAQPVLKGSVAVTGWTLHSGNIWKAPLSQATKQVFVNGALQEIARFPNTGWLRVDQGTSTSLTDSELNQASGYWTGATAVIRTTNWSYDTAYVSAFSNSTLTHTATGNNLGTWQWGYFMRNKLALLDAPGEWFHDRATGMLYLWCPNNANPNTVLVEAAVTDYGLYGGWQRHHIKVSEIHFRHHTTASLRLSGTTDLEAFNCTFTDTWQAIYSTGSNQHFHHLDVQRTYGSAVVLLDNNSVLEQCTFTNIAMVKGLGEQNMGYIAIRTNGTGMTVRDNRVENVGYCGIAVNNNAIVERNLVINSMAILNDGAGITFDQTDGAIIRDNVVRDLNGDVESSAIGWVHSVPICMGIYFGNVFNKNILVKGNTVMNCKGSGMYVDHTMLFTGNRIEDNVLFNNQIQLFISDYSNYNGPGATAPFHVPAYNTVYSNNVFYSLNKDQLLIQQYHVYSANFVDFGTWTGNRYFSPYNDRSIYLRNSVTGAHDYYTLERWQAVMNEDPTGTRSPLYLPSMEVQQVLATLAVPNGTFGSNVTGWTGWPSQGVITHNTTKLDVGCLKTSFTSNATYGTHNLNHSATVGVQQDSWYRMKFSMVGDVMGELVVGFKANSQANDPFRIGERPFPFDANRRDVEHFFQSDRTDQGVCMFTSSYTAGIYYLDNVTLERVTAVPVDPLQRQMILVNEQATAQVFSIPAGCWKDTDGNVMGASITLQPYKSRVIYRYAIGTACGQQVDCAGVPGGTAVAGTACNDNNACTTNDTWNASCQCVGTPSTPTASISAGGATSFCTGGSVVLSAATGTGYTYQWRKNGTSISGATSSSYTATASGSYTVVVTSGGCSSTSPATTVTVSAAPSATISAGGATTFCNGGSVTLSANTGTGLTHLWRKNGINISGATTSSYTATTAGSYTVVVTSGGCSTTSAATSVTVNAAPTASVTASGATSFCTGGNVLLTAATGTGYTYQWRNNGTNISGATSNTYSATASGSYTVVVTGNGCSTTSAATTVTVSAAPSATITAGGATTFCNGGSVVLSANTGSGLTYQWRVNGASISGATASSYTATTAGSYTVVVTNGGCTTTSAAATVAVNASPTASVTASGATSFCTGGNVVLTAATGTGYTYQWRNNGTNISGATASSYTAAATGSYTVRVTSGGCTTTSAATQVTVSAAPSATITAGGATTFCNGGSVVLNANTGTGLTYQWRKNGINISGATAITYTATTNGSYTLVVTSGGCSTTSAATSVTVNAAPTASITAGGATSFCTGGNVVLSATAGTGYTYQWRRNGTNLSGATTSSYTASTAGSYTVLVTSGACSSTSAATTVTVSTAPTATITAGGITSFCAGGNVLLSANAGTGLTYQWRRDGTTISGATASSYTATLSGAYTVVVANGGCSATSAATTVTVKAAPVVSCSANAGTSTVSVAATGGQSPYTYSWNTSPVQASATATVAASGTYTSTVTGANGCSASCSSTITLAGGSCVGIRTETQNTWGSVSTTSASVAYLHANFAGAFPAPNYLTIGCGQRLVRFTTSQAVAAALPLYGDFALLPTGTTVNPAGAVNNAFLGNLTALKLNIRFDEVNASFSPATVLLKNMVVAQGTFAGWTVQQVADLADQTLGGCVTTYTFNTVNTIVRNINSGYQGGTMNSGVLSCPGMAAIAPEAGDGSDALADELRATAFPNPAMGATTISITGLDPAAPLEVRVFDLSGALVHGLYLGEAPESGMLQLPWDASGRAAGMYFYEAVNGDRAVRGKVILE